MDVTSSGEYLDGGEREGGREGLHVRCKACLIAASSRYMGHDTRHGKFVDR